MPDFRRNLIPGASYFLTIVTYQRRPLFKEQFAKDLFWQVMEIIETRYPFKNEVFCLLPDHFHCIWTLPEDDHDYSKRVKELKRIFSLMVPQDHKPDPKTLSASRQKRHEGGLWHRRFWEHTIRSQEDYNRIMDYIHWNPVKHGYTDSPYLWEGSSFQRYVELGIYPPDWQSEHSLPSTTSHP